MIYVFHYSVEIPNVKELGEGIIRKTIKAGSLYDACRLCFLNTFSGKYRPAYSEKIKKLIPVSQNFNELKESYLKLDFYFETVVEETS